MVTSIIRGSLYRIKSSKFGRCNRNTEIKIVGKEFKENEFDVTELGPKSVDLIGLSQPKSEIVSTELELPNSKVMPPNLRKTRVVVTELIPNSVTATTVIYVFIGPHLGLSQHKADIVFTELKIPNSVNATEIYKLRLLRPNLRETRLVLLN